VESRIHFRARVSKKAVAQRTVKQMLRNLFEDSPREAIAFLLKEESLDADELNEIRKMIDAYDEEDAS
jgi:predicted transcriptional regulator